MLEIIFKIIVVSLLLAMGYYDFKKRIISNKAVLLMMVLGIVNLICFSSGIFPFISSFVLAVIMFAYHFYGFKKGKVGGGDVKLFVVVPFLFPIPKSAFAVNSFLYVLLITMIISVILFAYSRFMGGKDGHTARQIPMALPLGLASLIVAFL